jgi:hypothetical protein
MKRSGELEPTGVFALLAGAKCAPESADQPASPTTAPRTDEALTVFTSVDEARAAVDTAAASARRLLSIYTPDLEPELYDQTAVLEVVKRFVLSRSFSKVRVLLADSARAVRDDNRFAAMGRRLSSCIDIRRVGGPRPQRACAYLIADDRAIVYRLRADTWDGIADLDNPPVARLYLAEFDELWSRSAPRDALRIARTRG